MMKCVLIAFIVSSCNYQQTITLKQMCNNVKVIDVNERAESLLLEKKEFNILEDVELNNIAIQDYCYFQ